MGTRGMGHLAGVLLGSVAYGVIRRASLPVTVVPERAEHARCEEATNTDVHRVLLAIDQSHSAGMATNYVLDLCRRCASLEVELLNVQRPVPALCFENQAMADSYYQAQGEAGVQEIREAVRAASANFNVHLEAGDVVERIIQTAERRRCTRIVMGTRGLNLAVDLLLGSVAYKVLQQSSIPITLVKEALNKSFVRDWGDLGLGQEGEDAV